MTRHVGAGVPMQEVTNTTEVEVVTPHRSKREQGASAVEFALVAPILFLVLLGIVEFGYLFAEFNEIRHAAREGARVAAVSNPAFDQDADGDFDAGDIVAYTCDVLNLPMASTTVGLTQTGTTIGETATITVTIATPSLSGAPVISTFLPSSLSNTATFVLEQPATWSSPGDPRERVRPGV